MTGTKQRLSKRTEAKLAAISEQQRSLRSELDIAVKVLEFVGKEGWDQLAERLMARREFIIHKLATPSLDAESRAFYSGSLTELNTLLRVPDRLKSGKDSIPELKKKLRSLRDDAERVQDRDQVFGEDPDYF